MTARWLLPLLRERTFVTISIAAVARGTAEGAIWHD